MFVKIDFSFIVVEKNEKKKKTPYEPKNQTLVPKNPSKRG